MYLLDTVVLSELRKPHPNSGLAAWMAANSEADFFISVISLGEIERGLQAVAGRDAEFAAKLRLWMDTLLEMYAHRLLPVSVPVALRWGRLSVEIGNAGADVLLAATALEYGLAVVTRNERHFSALGVPVYNPWQ